MDGSMDRDETEYARMRLAREEALVDEAMLHQEESRGDREFHQMPQHERRTRFVRTVRAIGRIVDGRMFRAVAKSVEEYFKKRWRMQRAQAYRFVMCSSVIAMLGPAVADAQLPHRERLCRTLKKLGAAHGDGAIGLRRLWNAALDTHVDEISSNVLDIVSGIIKNRPNCKLTEDDISSVHAQISASTKRPKPPTASQKPPAKPKKKEMQQQVEHAHRAIAPKPVAPTHATSLQPGATGCMPRAVLPTKQPPSFTDLQIRPPNPELFFSSSCPAAIEIYPPTDGPVSHLSPSANSQVPYPVSKSVYQAFSAPSCAPINPAAYGNGILPLSGCSRSRSASGDSINVPSMSMGRSMDLSPVEYPEVISSGGEQVSICQESLSESWMPANSTLFSKVNLLNVNPAGLSMLRDIVTSNRVSARLSDELALQQQQQTQNEGRPVDIMGESQHFSAAQSLSSTFNLGLYFPQNDPPQLDQGQQHQYLHFFDQQQQHSQQWHMHSGQVSQHLYQQQQVYFPHPQQPQDLAAQNLSPTDFLQFELIDFSVSPSNCSFPATSGTGSVASSNPATASRGSFSSTSSLNESNHASSCSIKPETELSMDSVMLGVTQGQPILDSSLTVANYWSSELEECAAAMGEDEWIHLMTVP
ncbi:hypothetical protein BC830DRAFT_1119931, partial [Chytriomyces sp. MP71]